jgi:hypothetical protein
VEIGGKIKTSLSRRLSMFRGGLVASRVMKIIYLMAKEYIETKLRVPLRPI